ncbi:cardiolipin synthase [Microbacterium thalassium]|uniref:Cardiolipin synthase n=1 Tax=Microbacterium thalassium TaxID=362649 RepID=A0A7X0FMN1_9MICO|nr:cardiolipin synthase [Microbacterium thalassium]MBB6389801.1 cardiolipin synthase [Microbacterium thalassium]GLK24489.1 cardiolipin synthase [Microbacterium thalassium]
MTTGFSGFDLASLIALVLTLAIDITALIVIPRRRKPTAAMAWLLAIFLIPIVGIVLFLLIGTYRLPKARRDEQARIDGLIASRARSAGLHTDPSEWPRWFQRVVEQNETLTSIPAVNGNRAVLEGDYTSSIDAMARAMDTAERFIHVEFYIVSWDDTTRRFFSAMEAAVARGVTVRLLADYVASRRTARWKQTFAELDRIEVTWQWMLPVQPFQGKFQRPDLRNHRKLVVVDGRVAFVGSQNLIDRSYNAPKNIKRGLQWQELMTSLEGPAVAEVNAVFLSDWLIETGELLRSEQLAVADIEPYDGDDALVCQVLPSGPGYSTENNLRLFLSLIHGATEKVILTSPYFVPDEAMVYAITTACQRGLDVQLFVSEIGDQWLVYHAQRSYYEALLEAGVRIFLYPAPYILHAKHFSIDDDIAVIGSSNMDIRSFSLNMEVSMLVRGESFVAQMREVEQGYRDAGRELTLEQWRSEPGSATFMDGVARLMSALT